MEGRKKRERETHKNSALTQTCVGIRKNAQMEKFVIEKMHRQKMREQKKNKQTKKCVNKKKINRRKNT